MERRRSPAHFATGLMRFTPRGVDWSQTAGDADPTARIFACRKKLMPVPLSQA
ncbi:hypothetical protein SAMN05443245_3607 [Paraburkholderia fungorum]|uniref:Uncharacterized protein n=1 Tax=Paraburkholderia fungorum TaxID=134537 RepID=A0A1H1H7E1_9BURK|nr:hypothetical protein SAMN05443245_3607 [Paraburkholderia fungorum]